MSSPVIYPIIYSNTILGRLLQLARKRAKLTQTAIAPVMGVAACNTSRWETGRYDLSCNHLWQWAVACNTSPHMLLRAFGIALEQAKAAGYVVEFGCAPEVNPSMVDHTSAARWFAGIGFDQATKIDTGLSPNPYCGYNMPTGSSELAFPSTPSDVA